MVRKKYTGILEKPQKNEDSSQSLTTALPTMKTHWILHGFPSVYEKEFRQEDLRFSLNLTRFYLLCSGLMFGLFPLVTLVLPPDLGSSVRPTVFINIRNIIVPLSALICFLATFWKRYPSIAGYLNCIYVLLFSTGITGWMALSPPDSPAYLLHYACLILGCLVLNIGGYLRLPYVAITGALIIAEYSIASIGFERVLDTRSGTAFFTHNLLFLFAAYIFGLASNLASEYYRRNLFLIRKRIRLDEESARHKAFEEWKEAYSIFHVIHNRNRTKKRESSIDDPVPSTETPAARYIDKIRNDRLVELIRSFDVRTSTGHVFDRILDFVINISGSQWGAIAIRNDHTGEPVYVARRGIERRKTSFIMGIISETISTGHQITVNIVLDRGDSIHQAQARDNGIRSLFCFPVSLRGAAIGACYLDKGLMNDGFSSESADLISSLVAQVVLSVDEPDWLDDEQPKEIDESIFNSQCEKFAFTPRERQVALHVVKGLSRRKICSKLFITENTFRTHLKNINGKAGAENRSELLCRLGSDDFN
jgi:DNA-binding CsgD family transcriptional regulator